MRAVHDYFLLKEEHDWSHNKDTYFECIELFVDLGYLGIADDFIIQKLNIPIKKPQKSKNNPDPQLIDEQKEHNKTVSQTESVLNMLLVLWKFSILWLIFIVIINKDLKICPLAFVPLYITLKSLSNNSF